MKCPRSVATDCVARSGIAAASFAALRVRSLSVGVRLCFVPAAGERQGTSLVVPSERYEVARAQVSAANTSATDQENEGASSFFQGQHFEARRVESSTLEWSLLWPGGSMILRGGERNMRVLPRHVHITGSQQAGAESSDQRGTFERRRKRSSF